MADVNVPHRDFLEVKTSNGLKIIHTKDILFIEAAKKCSIVYFTDLSSLITFHLLKWYEIQLLKPFFFRCHNSFIINCRYVDCYNHSKVSLKRQKKIPLSRKKTKSFKENLEYLQGELS